MPNFLETYPNEAEARKAVDALGCAGVTNDDIHLLTGNGLHDVRTEVVGGFGGPVAPDAPVGTFANVPVPRRSGAGTFAGDADRQRQGSFADVDRTAA